MKIRLQTLKTDKDVTATHLMRIAVKAPVVFHVLLADDEVIIYPAVYDRFEVLKVEDKEEEPAICSA